MKRRDACRLALWLWIVIRGIRTLCVLLAAGQPQALPELRFYFGDGQRDKAEVGRWWLVRAGRCG
jgi:hypothetical protein